MLLKFRRRSEYYYVTPGY